MNFPSNAQVSIRKLNYSPKAKTETGLNMPNLNAIFGSIPSETNNAQNVEGQINEHSPTHGLNLDKEIFGEKDASLHEDD
ncbi:uncharacterized protein G2W53_028943 [Senna tora]|uniref:Uncharacterized protein n=1 Tax=Senna tora TaxID=362788 RepID=A0A834T394_9FABA|nr:uncharacterized protein G2W53_028943 [Senna tora]